MSSLYDIRPARWNISFSKAVTWKRKCCLENIEFDENIEFEKIYFRVFGIFRWNLLTVLFDRSKTWVLPSRPVQKKSETSDADKEFLSPSISRPAHHKIEGKLEPSLEALGET